jgi:5-methylcytosine-specific restriction enzyme subunit McrC
VRIPIANTFRLLAYAWDVVEEADARLVGTEPLLAPVDALGHALAGAVGDLIRRGIRREYVESDEVVAGIRGKLLIGATVQRNLLPSARTMCRVAELTEDTLANRLVRAAVHAVLSVRQLDAEVRAHLEEVARRISTIPLIRPQLPDYSRVRIHRNNRLYRLVLSICRLIHENLIPDEQDGSSSFRDFRRDRKFMWRLFERFAFRFYEREQPGFRVSRPRVGWADLESFDSDPRRLPQMHTDIVLRGEHRTIIIDTKFYRHPLARGRFGDLKIRSANLYQLLTYVGQWQRSALWSGEHVDGMLLYPAVNERFDFRYKIGGVGVRAVTVDLAQAWPRIRSDLLGLLEPWPRLQLVPRGAL